MRFWAALAGVFLTGCGNYGDFRLPAATGAPRELRWMWTPHPQPVLSTGGAGAFDATDALNPAIVRTDSGYINLFSGWDGRVWRTGLALSPDGIGWEKKGMVIAPEPGTWEGDYIAANGALQREGNSYLYWYQAGTPPQIGLATATDPVNWEKVARPVLPPGPRGAWDERGVGDPYVIAAGGRFYMYFLGQDRARRQRLGVATSADGKTWTKLRSNPILELGAPGAFDETGLGEPAVWQQFGKWWMLYTGRNRKEWRRIGLASSEDGVTWKRVDDKPLIDVGEGWNGKVVCDPEVEVLGDGRVRVWFGGGDRPEPAENLHGQIGIGELRATAVER